MSSSISLLPTVEFLEAIAQQQWSTNSQYAIAFSTVPARFFSTTNSEWVCLNSESELLSSRFGTAAIEPDFGFTRAELSPVFVASNEIKIKGIESAKSMFLYRSNGEVEEIIFNTNYDKNENNQTTAPLLDCFSRECMSWFPSTADYFIGFGCLAGSLSQLIIGEDGVILTKSEDILASVIPESTRPCSHSDIQVLGNASTSSPFITIQLSTTVEYINTESTPDPNLFFLYNSDSIVSFAYQFTAPQTTSISYNMSITEIRFTTEDIVII